MVLFLSIIWSFKKVLWLLTSMFSTWLFFFVCFNWQVDVKKLMFLSHKIIVFLPKPPEVFILCYLLYLNPSFNFKFLWLMLFPVFDFTWYTLFLFEPILDIKIMFDLALPSCFKIQFLHFFQEGELNIYLFSYITILI